MLHMGQDNSKIADRKNRKCYPASICRGYRFVKFKNKQIDGQKLHKTFCAFVLSPGLSSHQFSPVTRLLLCPLRSCSNGEQLQNGRPLHRA